MRAFLSSVFLLAAALAASAVAAPQRAEARVDEVDDPQIRRQIAADRFGFGKYCNGQQSVLGVIYKGIFNPFRPAGVAAAQTFHLV
jgi:hypothetical protein